MMRINYTLVPSTLKASRFVKLTKSVHNLALTVSSQVPSSFSLKEAATASIELYYLSLEYNFCFASTN